MDSTKKIDDCPQGDDSYGASKNCGACEQLIPGSDNQESGECQNTVYIVDTAEYQARLDKLMALDRDELDNKADFKRKVLFERSRDSLCSARQLTSYKSRVLDDVCALKDSYPNASQVIDRIYNTIALEKGRGADYAKLSRPLLLQGPAGSGKTSLARAIAEAVGVDLHLFYIGNMQEGFALSGLDLGYDSGKPGLIAETLIKIDYANPWILLDEVDKSPDQRERTPPSVPLLMLLEQDTSKAFRDIAFDMDFDMSYASFIATANDLDRIAAPLLDRFQVLEVPYPTVDQMEGVIRHIWSDIRGAMPWGSVFDGELSGAVIDQLAGLSPRQVKGSLIDMAGAAYVRYDRNSERSEAELISMEVCDLDLAGNRKARGIGFHAEL